MSWTAIMVLPQKDIDMKIEYLKRQRRYDELARKSGVPLSNTNTYK